MDKTSAAILKIRAAAGNPNERCPTCGKSPESPFRRYDGRGHVFGCVDAIHAGHLIPGSESSRWHNRPAAKALRANELRRLRDLRPRRRR